MLTTIVADDTDYNVYSPISRVCRPAGVASRGALQRTGRSGACWQWLAEDRRFGTRSHIDLTRRFGHW